MSYPHIHKQWSGSHCYTWRADRIFPETAFQNSGYQTTPYRNSGYQTTVGWLSDHCCSGYQTTAVPYIANLTHLYPCACVHALVLPFVKN